MEQRKIVEMTNLEIDCKIGKDRHFIAADRKNKWRIKLGLFAVIGSAIISSGIGSSFLDLLGSSFHKLLLLTIQVDDKNDFFWKLISNFLSHILPLLVGISTSIIGFLGLEKQTTQHRIVGNAYIEIARKTRALINSIDTSNFNEKIVEYNVLLEKYLEVNKDGESCPTNNKDSYKAMKMNSSKRNAIKSKISEFENAQLNIKPKPYVKKTSINSLLSNGVKKIMARILLSIHIISPVQYRKYLSQLI